MTLRPVARERAASRAPDDRSIDRQSNGPSNAALPEVSGYRLPRAAIEASDGTGAEGAVAPPSMFALVRMLRAAAPWITATLACVPLAAQCAPSWQPGAPTAGPSDVVYALARAANGDLYAGGRFAVADGTFVHNIARWDGSAWHALGTGLDGWVSDIALLPNGNIIVGGFFTTAGGVVAPGIAEWNGTQWSALGSGVGGFFEALLVLPNGDLIAGGYFGSVGAGIANIARWSNGTWSALGTGFAGDVRCLALLPNGEIVAGGVAIGGFALLQRWNGTTWTPMPMPMPMQMHEVRALAVAPNGNLFIGGYGTTPLVSWNGTTFSSVPVPSQGLVTTLAIEAATGALWIGGPPAMNVLRWDGTALTNLSGNTTSWVNALAQLANGELVAGGERVSQVEARTVRRLSGSTWLTVGAPAPAPVDVHVLATLPNGDIVAGGLFGALEGTPLANIGRWDGAQWHALGAGVDGSVEALAVAANGDLIVGGWFTHAGGAPAQYVARWNGAAWSTLGAGPPDGVWALTTRTNGDVLALAAGAVMRWNGSAWTSLTVGTNYRALATLPGDDVVAVGLGVFGSSMIWNGSTFAALGPLSGLGLCLLVRHNGDLIVGGTGLQGGNTGIARWTGSTWVPLGAGIAGEVWGLAELPNGDLVAAARLISTTAPPSACLMRWNGSTWSVLDGSDGIVFDVAANERGELFAAGYFAHVGSGIAANFARSVAPCPASASTYGAGCSGSAGPVTLAAHSLPWTGSTFTGVAHGMAPLSLALHVVGVGAVTQPLPLGAPGCGLFVAPILSDVLFPTGGLVSTPLTIPNTATLAGAQLRTQVVGLELDSSLALLRTTSTNALLLTIGAL